jgi:raffinose/stachyose/melibiose transport system permease protein
MSVFSLGALSRRSTQVLLGAWTLFSVVPFILIALSSLRNNFDLSQHPFGTGGAYRFGNYSSAWQGPYGSAGMATFLTNSAKAAITALMVNVSIGTSAAYFATGLRYKTQMRVMQFFLLGTVIPFVLLLIPYFRAYQALSQLNSPVAIGVAYGVLGLPTTILILFAFFRDFPHELREAAAIDGMGPARTYLSVVLPLSKGAIVGASLLMLIWVWNETQLAIVLLQNAPGQTVPVGVLGFQGSFTTDYGPLFAGLSIAVMPVLLLYLVFSRHVNRAVQLGGVSR